MNKTLKNILLLSTVFTLTSCGDAISAAKGRQVAEDILDAISGPGIELPKQLSIRQDNTNLENDEVQVTSMDYYDIDATEHFYFNRYITRNGENESEHTDLIIPNRDKEVGGYIHAYTDGNEKYYNIWHLEDVETENEFLSYALDRCDVDIFGREYLSLIARKEVRLKVGRRKDPEITSESYKSKGEGNLTANISYKLDEYKGTAAIKWDEFILKGLESTDHVDKTTYKVKLELTLKKPYISYPKLSEYTYVEE